MPTVHREAGFHFRVLSNDHGPAHVLVVKAGGSAKIILGDGDEAPLLHTVHGLKDPQVVRAVRIVQQKREKLLAAWEAIHGGQHAD